MRRRGFLFVLGGAAATWAFSARAQRPTGMPVIGYLHSSSPQTNVKYLAAFRKGLGQAGFVEGRNVEIEFRWASGQLSRLPKLAADLVRRHVDVIATPANTPAALAAEAATKSIPIVFSVGSDPVAMGLVASLNRPGGNATGISFQTEELVAKRLGLLRELAPLATHFAALVNPKSPFAPAIVKDLQASARALRIAIEILYAGTSGEIIAAFATLAQEPGSALLVSPDALFTSRRGQIVTLAARYALPAVYSQREFAEIGGLVAYGPSFVEVYQLTGLYCGRVLKGEKPANMPVERPTNFDLVVNLTTAKALALTVPPFLLATANEVIE